MPPPAARSAAARRVDLPVMIVRLNDEGGFVKVRREERGTVGGAGAWLSLPLRETSNDYILRNL